MKHLLLAMWIVLPVCLMSQVSTTQLLQDRRVDDLIIDSHRQTPSYVKLNPSQNLKSTQEATSLLSSLLQLKNTDQSLQHHKHMEVSGQHIDEYRVHRNGIPIEHATIKTLSDMEVINSLYMELYYDFDNRPPSLTPERAKANAYRYVDADMYAEEELQRYRQVPVSPDVIRRIDDLIAEYAPEPELVYVDDYDTPEAKLYPAYKISVYATEPLSRDLIYVSAIDGEILLVDPIIKHGRGQTRYSGERDFPTSIDDAHFLLSGVDPVSGVQIETYSLDGVGGTPVSVSAIYDLAVDVEDDDDTWTSPEHRLHDLDDCSYTPAIPGMDFLCNEANNDDIALDAQFGAMVVAQYWHNIHNRNSYDGEGADIVSYVHYGDAYDNAFWNGTNMTYGDGSYQSSGSGFFPLTSMDVCAHEIGHAVCTHTSNLVYQRESGAMNEGFSDIWGACVEYYVLQHVDGALEYDPWGIGEQIDGRDDGAGPGDATARALRWMDDPQAEGSPDTYGGNHWTEPECGEPNIANDNCGVHTNSGVLNKWFYLLVSGSGLPFSPGNNKATVEDEINDVGDVYDIAGIGFEKAEQITFLAETLLTPNAKFEEMRNVSIAAAEVLYGPCSPEVVAVTDAWYAVNVGETFEACDPFLSLSYITPSTELNEKSSTQTCAAAEVYEINVFNSGVSGPVTLSIVSSAIAGVDYDILSSPTQLVTGQSETIELVIYDDREVETEEEIQLSILAGAYADTLSMTIIDDDVVPMLGTDLVPLLSEEFEGTDIPSGWSQLYVNVESVCTWRFDGTTEAGRAYVSDSDAGTASYVGADSHVILVSPEINALGLTDVHLSFDWTVGGEYDGALFDYGALVYSLDGVNFKEIEQYHGANLGLVATGTFDSLLTVLDNAVFHVGFKWYNDALLNGTYTFSIDNVSLQASPSQIETDSGATSEVAIAAGVTSYFVSDSSQVMSRVTAYDTQLGCTTVTIADAHESMDTVRIAGGYRSAKVFSVSPTIGYAPYRVTLFYTADEVADWQVPLSELKIAAISGIDLTDYDDQGLLIEPDAITVDDHRAEQEYVTFSFDYQGMGSFALTDMTCFDTVSFGGVGYAGDQHAVTQAVGAGELGGDMVVTAGMTVELLPSFSVPADVSFEASIADCPE